MSGNTTRSKGQCHTGHLIFLSCPLHGFRLIWPNHFICVIHSYTTHNEAMCRAPFLIESLHMWHTYNAWGDDVSCPICMTKGQRSRSHGSFQFLALSDTWLRPYLAESLHMWHTCNTWGGNVSRTIFRMKGRSQSHKSRSKFLPSTLHGFLLIWPNDLAYIQQMRGRWVVHHFSSFVRSVAPCLSDWPLVTEGCHSY